MNDLDDYTSLVGMRIEVHKVCVYAHSIDGVVIYVGKGREGRATSVGTRNKVWRQLVEAAGYFDVEVLAWYEHNEDAKLREAQEIRSLRPAANMHLNGYTISAAHRKAISDAQRLRAQRSPESIRASANKRRGVKRTPEQCARIVAGRRAAMERRARVCAESS